MSDGLMIVSAGTITGPMHKRNNEVNQDSYSYVQESGYTVIAAADGAGSLGENSAVGASLASSVSVEKTLEALLEGDDIEEALQKGIEEARDTLIEREDWDTLGCTLSVAVDTPDDGWGVALVGDAFAVISVEEENHVLIHREPDSEYANITKLLTSKNYDPLYVSGLDKIFAMSVASDGLTNLSINIADNEASTSFWDPIIQRASNDQMNVNAFLEFLERKEKLYDDTTLVIASKVK